MSQVKQLHDEAMLLAQEVMVALHHRDFTRAEELAGQAYTLEVQAASQLPVGKESEPTRSILYRSAAALALRAGNFTAALESIREARKGTPTSRVESELASLEVEALKAQVSVSTKAS